MRFDYSNARGYQVWDDATSRIVKAVRWVDDEKNQYAVCPPPIRVVNNEIVEEVRYVEKIVVYHEHKLVVINPKTVLNKDVARSLVELLSL